MPRITKLEAVVEDLRARAEEISTRADSMICDDARTTMRRIAVDYTKLADWLEIHVEK